MILDKYSSIINECFSQIRKQTKKPLLIGITGDSGSGKSYYSKLLQEKFTSENIPFVYLNADDFLIARKDREPMKTIFYTDGEFKGKSHWEILENMFRLDELRRVLIDLKNDKVVTYLPYQRETGGIDTKPKTLHPQNYILCDTSMLLELMDFVILVDVTQENIIKRKLIRDADVRTPEQIIDMHKRVQGYYWERSRPKKADIVIDNNDF
ncbi:MAG: sigma 54-interacting transcriptional regulator, partial [Patescibacteria group bacterium]